MKYETAIYLVAFFGLASAAPAPKAGLALARREVPQEHSHEKFLTGVRTMLALNNPAGIADPVFGLLGNAAAAQGAGTITNLDCLHQATADQAFTNAKAAGNVQGMTDALLYAALERNTGKVGQASVLCTDAAVNAEIGAISQHQDPASEGVAATNKAITLELARQLAAIGADPLIALQSGTFEPGDLNDATGAGNTCDTLDDPEGCIFTQNLLVEDATAEEIAAAVGAGAGADAGAGAGADAGADADADADAGADAGAGAGGDAVEAPPAAHEAMVEPPAVEDGAACPVVSTVTVDAPAATAAPEPVASAPAAEVTAPAVPATPTTGGSNVQTFTGSLGGPPPAVESSAGDRPFSVNGNTFVNIGAALQRSCAIQNNACANAVNSGQLDGSVGDCNAQERECLAAGAA